MPDVRRCARCGLPIGGGGHRTWNDCINALKFQNDRLRGKILDEKRRLYDMRAKVKALEATR